MQYYYDTLTNKQYAFEDTVIITEISGKLIFTTTSGTVLGPYPDTLVIGTAATMVPTLALAQDNQITILSAACSTAITTGFVTNINGISTTVTLSTLDQSNANFNAGAAQAALQSTPWSAGTVYLANSTITSGDTILVTFTGGTTGTTVVVPPVNFEIPTIDGTVTWYKLGFWVNTSEGSIMVDSAAMVSLFKQCVVWINACRSKYEILKVQILSTKTTAEVLAVVWV